MTHNVEEGRRRSGNLPSGRYNRGAGGLREGLFVAEFGPSAARRLHQDRSHESVTTLLGYVQFGQERCPLQRGEHCQAVLTQQTPARRLCHERGTRAAFIPITAAFSPSALVVFLVAHRRKLVSSSRDCSGNYLLRGAKAAVKNWGNGMNEVNPGRSSRAERIALLKRRVAWCASRGLPDHQVRCDNDLLLRLRRLLLRGETREYLPADLVSGDMQCGECGKHDFG